MNPTRKYWARRLALCAHAIAYAGPRGVGAGGLGGGGGGAPAPPNIQIGGGGQSHPPPSQYLTSNITL